MNTHEKFNLITKNCEEVMTEQDLKKYLSRGIPIKHYIGFEISGRIHLGTGLVCMQKIKDFSDAGCKVNIFLADWHTWINDKLSPDREKIKKIANGYFKQGLKIVFKILGGDPAKLNFILGSNLYDENKNYWPQVVEVAKNTTLSRAKRSISILGRDEGDDVDFAKLIYPMMQVADIFTMGINLSHAGCDQRKAHVIARQVAKKITISPLVYHYHNIKPIGIHHKLLLGLQKPTQWPIPKNANIKDLIASMKMSKSNPDSAVFIDDSPQDISRKIQKAFCPEKEIQYNPILDWAEQLIFSREKEITILRDSKYGGDLTFTSFEKLQNSYQKGELHPQDLKNFVSNYLIELLKPARDYFHQGAGKRYFSELTMLSS